MSSAVPFLVCSVGALAFLGATPETIPPGKITSLFEFGDAETPWRPINDGVMGGVSKGRFTVDDGVAIFQGDLSLENNGGFASARSVPRAIDLSGGENILLRVKGDGKRYAFRLRTTDAFDGVSYQARFDTVAGEWRTITIPLKEFVPVFRGRQLRDVDPLDPAAVRTMGVLISDKQVGPFRLEIDWIRLHAPESED